VPVAGQILKDKLNDEDTLVRLVFDQVIDPLVGQVVSDSTVLVVGIEITEADISGSGRDRCPCRPGLGAR
jgi:hypothetical protein